MTDIESRLSQLLRERAEDLPVRGGLAEQIIARAEHRAAVADIDTARGRRRGWTGPLLAAAVVVALVVGVVLLAGLRVHHDQDPTGPTPTAPTPSPSLSTSHTTSTSPSPSTSSTVPAAPPRIANFAMADLTWVGSDDGYGLGTGDCLSGAGTCTALIHTTDGVHWYGVSGATTPFNIAGPGCTTRCVSGIRFADDRVGYVFGQNTLLMTTDGGRSWQLQAGGASALEVADGIALRIEPGTTQQLLRSTAGTASWLPVTLPAAGAVAPQPVQLVRSGRYVLVSSGLPNYLFRSSDDGAGWQSAGEICPGSAASLLAVAADGSAAWVCTAAGPGLPASVQVYRTTASGPLVLPTGGRYAGAPAVPGSGSVLVSLDYGSKQPVLYRLSGGRSVPVATGASAAVNGRSSFLGCESASVCRWVPGDGSGLYTSRDGGRSWTHTSF